MRTHELGCKKGDEKQDPGGLSKRPALRPCDKDECLTDDTYLEIDSRFKRGKLRKRITQGGDMMKGNYSEEISVRYKEEEESSHESLVGSKSNASGKDFVELPGVWHSRRLHPILRDSHDGSIIEDSDDEDHERPGSVKTISEALLAASVASATAMPMSAFFSAGASFTPSPVIPQIDHLDIDTKFNSPLDGLSTVMSWRIKERQQTNKFPCTLIVWIERQKMHFLNVCSSLLGITQHANNASINGILVLNPGGSSSKQQDIIFTSILNEDLNQALVNCELVKGEGTSLITAKHIHTSHFFNGSHPLSDGTLLFCYLLEVTNIVGAIDEMSSLSKEGADAGGDDDGVDLSLLHGGAGVGDVPGCLSDRQGFTCESRLINLEGIPFQEASICGDDISKLDADDIAGD
nr:hypothetical protein CRG98_026008 [Ipomoea batatas]